jgi:hypothetical protein
VIRQLGHTDPALTLRIYAHDVARGEDERQRLRALVEGRDVGCWGIRPPRALQRRNSRPADGIRKPRACGPFLRVSDGTRTHDRLDHNQELYQLSYAHREASESSSGFRAAQV